MQILNIGTPIFSIRQYEVRNIEFLSNITLLDADLIFWDVNSSHSQFPGSPNNLNNTQSQSTIQRINQSIENRKKELDEYFSIGRTLIITSPIFKEYQYSYKENDKIDKLDFINCLDISKPDYSLVSGQNMQTIDESFIHSYHHLNTKNFQYNLKIIKSNGIPLFYIKGTDYVVSEFYRIKNGLLVILPIINFKKASDNVFPFFDSTTDFIEELKTYKLPKLLDIPEWVKEYTLSAEQKELIKQQKLFERQKKIEQEIESNNIKLSNYHFLKSLFASSGDTLENAVKFVFKEFGFELEEPKKNRDDLIIKTGSKIAVIEIKGLTKSAAEKNAAQLQKWVSSYHVENDINPKGILIVNTYKNLKLENRTEIDFPNQMLAYSNQMKLCLITGLQLLCMYLDFSSKKLSKKKIIELLFNTIGELKYKENNFELINKQSNTVATKNGRKNNSYLD